MSTPEIHRLVQRSDLPALRRWLQSRSVDVDHSDGSGLTPLMLAARDPLVDPEVVRLLLSHGARVDLEYRDELGTGLVRCSLGLALWSGHPAKVRALLDAGARLRETAVHEDDMLLVAVHGRDLGRDPHLLELLRLLIEHGVDASRISCHKESALRVLAREARFDGVQLLLKAGADEQQLRWTPLLRAAALGKLPEVEQLAREGASLEDRDCWSRTPWLLAILAGDLAKVQLLQQLGADVNARGDCEATALICAVQGRHPRLLQWLISTGHDVEGVDQLGRTALIVAVELDEIHCVRTLLEAGADVHHGNESLPFPEVALQLARSGAVVRLLIERGAHLEELSSESRRALLGFSPEEDVAALDIPHEAFLRARTPRLGVRNPEPIDEPFWTAMIRAGVSGYAATVEFGGPSSFLGTPVWSAARFGQSLTLLPDGRIIQIAGEHEDSYDPDFYIYNDVFVHDPDGTIRIYGYPSSTFPPTDFHSATLIGSQIYVIGSLGYGEQPRYDTTPVYRLDTDTLAFERLDCTGAAPGWIYDHRARLISAHEIQLTGGTLIRPGSDREERVGNTGVFVLDTKTQEWRSTPTSS